MTARGNPFASHRIEALPFVFPPGHDWPSILSALEAGGWRGAIVGPCGTGKTQFIGELAPRLKARGFRPILRTLRAESTLAEKQALIAEAGKLSAPDFLLLDGAEQLATRHWLSLHGAARSCAGCIITLHRTGRLPTLLETASSPALLAALVETLCDARLPEGEAELLLRRHLGNLRECLRELYDRWDG
jgi:hypothetical protein